MPLFALLALLLCFADPASAQGDKVSLPLAFQVSASATTEPGENLARLTKKGNTAGVAVGQWMEFDFLKPYAVTRMTIVNGWADPAAFRRMGRIRVAVLHYGDGSRQTLHLKDTDKPQTFALKANSRTVRLDITEVYPGRSTSLPYVTSVAFEGYDPTVEQTTMTGRFEGCVRSRSSSSWEGTEDPLFYCARFRADDGRVFGCVDDLCFHTKEMVNARLSVTGVVKPGNVLEVLTATPTR